MTFSAGSVKMPYFTYNEEILENVHKNRYLGIRIENLKKL